MLIIGCDFHTRYQQTAMAEDQIGELLLERRLDHESGEAQAFYRSLQGPVRVGIEATGPRLPNVSTRPRPATCPEGAEGPRGPSNPFLKITPPTRPPEDTRRYLLTFTLEESNGGS